MERRLFVGRFQPPHNGHFHAISQMLDEFEGELIIVVAAAQHGYKGVNPFTAGERITMIREGMVSKDLDSSRILVFPAEDINDYALWPHHLERLVPEFSIVYSNNPLVQLLFRRAGFDIQGVKLWERETMSSSSIRKLMIEDDPSWKELVPERVTAFLERIGAVSRLKTITATDKVIDSATYTPHG